MTVDQSGGFPTTVVSQTTSLYLFIYNDRFGHTQRQSRQSNIYSLQLEILSTVHNYNNEILYN